MKIRAIIFDVYNTLMLLGPPPADAEDRWRALWLELTNSSSVRLSLTEFGSLCRRVVEREHAVARTNGILFPEIYWPAVVVEVLPELKGKGETACDAFIQRQTGFWHTVSLAPETSDFLHRARSEGMLLGIASNAQAYTLRELEAVLRPEGLGLDLFSPDLSFWSFENGFSKPDPHVFRILSTRLLERGIAKGDILMVGDREDNDIKPAAAEGWQTWQIREGSAGGAGVGGDWRALKRHLQF